MILDGPKVFNSNQNAYINIYIYIADSGPQFVQHNKIRILGVFNRKIDPRIPIRIHQRICVGIGILQQQQQTFWTKK